MRYELLTLKRDFEIKRIATLFYMEYDKDYVFNGERHDFWELIYCDSGEVYVDRDEERLLLRKGMVLFHQPGEFHTVMGNRKVSPNLVIISFDCRDDAMNLLARKMITLTNEEQRLLCRVVAEAEAAFQAEQKPGFIRLVPRGENVPFGAEQYVKNLLEIFFIELIRHLQSAETNAGTRTKPVGSNINTLHEDIVQTILIHLENNVQSQIRIKDLCEKLSMSHSYIEYIFKKATGKTIIAYHTELRIQLAKEMIRNKDYNFTQISEMLGFSSVHYFSRRFKKLTSMSPSEYAMSIKNKMNLIK